MKKYIPSIIAIAAFFALILILPNFAKANDDDKITMSFIAYGINPDFYAIHQKSKLSGDSLVVYKIGAKAPTLVYPLNGTSLQNVLQSKEVAPYGFTQEPVTGFTAPAGYQLGGQTIGENIHLILSAGDQTMTLGYATVYTDPTKTKTAKVTIKNAYWTPDSKRVVIIINQKLGGDWPIDTDILAAFILG